MAARLRSPHAACFDTTRRLHRKLEFDLLYREGRRYSDKYFLAVVRRNSLTHSRLGLSIGAKAAGNSVNRNRIKRVIRESFRLSLCRTSTLDVIVSARSEAKIASNAVLTESLEQLWDKLTRYA